MAVNPRKRKYIRKQLRPDPVPVEAHASSQARTDTTTVSVQLGAENDYEVDALILQELNQPSTQASQTQAPTNMEPLRPATRRKLQPLRSRKNMVVSQSPRSRISTRSVASSSAQVGIPTRTSPRAKKGMSFMK